jgi:hypothetical protein
MIRKAANAKMEMTRGAMTLGEAHPDTLPSDIAKTKRMSPTVREVTPGQSRLFLVFSAEEEAPGRINQEMTEKGITRIARR